MAEIQNLDRLISKLEKMCDAKTFTKGLEKACIIVENEAKKDCPVNDGQLRQSITHEVDGKDAVVGTNVTYAPYVEIGTGIFSSKGNGRNSPWFFKDSEGNWHSTIGQKPQPFLDPALQRSRKKIVDCMNESIMEGAKK